MKSKRAREAATEAVEDVLPLNDAATEDKKKRKRSEDESGEKGEIKKAKKDKKDKKDKTDKKKSKKGAFEETRREKKDKRKNLQDLPEEDADEEEVENQGDVAAPATADASKSKKEKSASKSSKSSKSAGTDATNEEKKTVEKTVATQDGNEESTKKKEKKAKKDKDGKSTPANEETTPADDPATETGKPSRHIVFVGNLPFSATASSIKAHFASLNPISVRCLKNKDDSNPCRGIAFVEFANVWSMRTCLDKFHHTIFEDGVSAGRKINVELTAGGGGSTKFRKDKIREKNVKLDENRAKRIEKEKMTKQQQGGGEKKGRQGKEAGVEVGVHPSRLARNPGLGGR
ncbi:hypothetical protein E4U58_003688 [Claviceps cyperi]|nr:hypothetical protein E4U58_003688 [Claviceps cyperi]